MLYVALNSQYYHPDCKNEQTAPLRAAQDAWAAETLGTAAARGAKHVVLLSHVAPCMGAVAEAEGHFNWSIEARERIVGLAERAGCRLWLCGHFHQNQAMHTAAGLEIVSTAAVGGVINWTRRAPAALEPCHTHLSHATLVPALHAGPPPRSRR